MGVVVSHCVTCVHYHTLIIKATWVGHANAGVLLGLRGCADSGEQVGANMLVQGKNPSHERR